MVTHDQIMVDVLVCRLATNFNDKFRQILEQMTMLKTLLVMI